MKAKQLTLVALLGLLAAPAFALVEYSNPVRGKDLPIGNMLEWSTQRENNCLSFVVEKSFDGVTFVSVGVVDAKNDFKGSAYRFLDARAEKGTSYYRLKQVDVDGAFAYSPVALISNSNSNRMLVVNMSDTRVNDAFEVTLDVMAEGRLDYVVRNPKGEAQMQGGQEAINGINRLSLNLGDLEAGTYKIEITLGDETETLTIRKTDDVQMREKKNMARKDRK